MSGLITHWVIYPMEDTRRYPSYRGLDGAQSGLDVLENREISVAATAI
jgi:hypothetical protein